MHKLQYQHTTLNFLPCANLHDRKTLVKNYGCVVGVRFLIYGFTLLLNFRFIVRNVECVPLVDI